MKTAQTLLETNLNNSFLTRIPSIVLAIARIPNTLKSLHESGIWIGACGRGDQLAVSSILLRYVNPELVPE